jgi:threonine dehydrogenase-like Zn-dependent dehydrogenase
MRTDERIVLGHEFSGVVAAAGKRSRIAEGTPVVSFPLLRSDGGVHPTGLSVHAPGAYAEQVLVEDALSLPVPNGLAPEVAALTEPLAVGLHAVRRGEVGKRQVAIVIGCGPVGLAVIGMLKASGVRTVVASDFSPGRRALASTMGADVVVDPATESPYSAAAGHGHLTTGPEVFELGVGTVEKLQRLPLVPWHQVWRVADKLGAATPKHPVVFECVGVPGVIEEIISSAPMYSRVVVVGVCMEPDRIRPAMAINKEVDLRFVLGYTPLEFRDALHLLADGKVDAAPMITGTVGLHGVATAFDALADPETHAKILVDPRSDATEPARTA